LTPESADYKFVNRIQRKITPAVFGTCFPALRQGYDNEKKDKARTYHEFVVDVLTHLPTARPATGKEYIDGEEDKKKKNRETLKVTCVPTSYR